MGLFCGKISLRDLTRRSEILNYEGLLLPPFLNDMDQYMQCLDIIAATNHIKEPVVDANKLEQII